MIDEFESMREFYKRFPSGFYVCSNCGYMNGNAYTCSKCGWRADGLLKTMNNGYRFKLKGSNTVEEIFIPIELSEKG